MCDQTVEVVKIIVSAVCTLLCIPFVYRVVKFFDQEK